MQIGRRIYYELATGNAIQDTGERCGSVIETTIEQDFAAYTTLNERVPESVGCIQLDFGELTQDFAECNGYRVNVDTQEIEFSYPDPSVPEAPPVYRKALTQEVADLKESNLNTMSALADVFEMVLNLQDQVIGG